MPHRDDTNDGRSRMAAVQDRLGDVLGVRVGVDFQAALFRGRVTPLPSLLTMCSAIWFEVSPDPLHRGCLHGLGKGHIWLFLRKDLQRHIATLR